MTGDPITLYVRTNGKDTNDGLTAATALLTIQAAAELLQKSVLNSAIATVDVGPGTFAGASFEGGGYINVTVTGAGQTATIINGPPRSGQFAGGALCFLATQGAVLSIKHVGISVPANTVGVFLQTFGSASLYDCRMTGADSTSIALHAEGYSFFEMADPAPCDFYGKFGNLVTVGANGHYLHDTGICAIRATVSGSLFYADALGNVRILIPSAFIFAGGSAAKPYHVAGNSSITSQTNLETASGKLGTLATGGRSSVPVHKTTEVAASGLPASVDGNACGGTITITGDGVTSGNQVLIAMHEIVLTESNKPAPYAVSVQTGPTGKWNSRATAQVYDNTGAGNLNILFDNNGVPLASGKTYHINYICGG